MILEKIIIPRLISDIKRAQKPRRISDSLISKIVDFHSKSLKIDDFRGNKDRFGTDLGSKTSRIPEHEIWGVIFPTYLWRFPARSGSVRDTLRGIVQDPKCDATRNLLLSHHRDPSKPSVLYSSLEMTS